MTLVSNVAAGESCELSESPLARYRYGYDERGNRTSEEYTGETVTVPELTSYGYDRADRLTGVAYADGTAKLYQLGGDGSRLAEKHVTPFSGDLGPDGWGVATGAVQTYAYDARGGLESITDEQGVAVVSYTVDLAGRVKVETRGTSRKELTWDAAGRLAEAKLGPAVAGGGGTVDTFTYRYDFAGRRIEKSGPGGDSRYLWGADDLVEEVAPSGTRLVYERMGGLVVGVSAYGAGGTPAGSERLMHDGLDTIVGRVRSDGSSSLYRYDAWGGFRGLGAPGAAEASLAYAGQHWDADVGLSYAQQRWYDPSVGRFLSEDPVFGDPTNPVSLHAWAYANGNPLAFIDPLGERAMTEAEKARDAEWYAEYLRRKAAWDKLPWYQKVGDVFDSDGNSQGAKVLARNINAYRRGIDQAADGEDVIAIDVAAEYGEGPVSISLPSGAQDMSRGPLVVPASRVDAVQAQRARNGQILAAVTAGPAASTAYAISDAVGVSEETKYNVTATVGHVESTAYAAAALRPGSGSTGLIKPPNLPVPSPRINLAGGRSTTGGAGRLGSARTRQQNADIATELEMRGWDVTGGGGRGKEEYLPGPGFSRKGSSWVDVTAQKNGRTLRINTVDTLADGVTPDKRESANAARIRAQTPGDHLLLIPKAKSAPAPVSLKRVAPPAEE
ncbi:RHS repeat-associated core domain-containing protein [Anaeromyxobacter sp. Fw109-5]|uniref:RHS repeat-associated core domain-containing protein n=1 Tax=Anaeromyxobacter sp. (strain Fw109-5) TaxID=404589 RepID=UPI001F2D2890|nr:RHS repeat-associated core domain-containing protein [Anaeromyxobacter sp. Fw109-5]